MVNYTAVIFASIIGYIIPMIWYSTFMFGRQWMRLSKVKEMKMSASIFVWGFITTFVFNYVLAIVIGYNGADTFIGGMGVGALLWLGFVATTKLGETLYKKMPIALFLINSIQYLVSMVIAGGIIAVWQ